METVELRAEGRNTTGKNKARQLRAVGKVPAVLYGYKTEPTGLAIDRREFETIMRAHAGANIIMKLKMDGREDASVIVKDLQRHPTRDNVIHIDLLSVALDEVIVTGVPVHIVGDSAAIKEGAVLQHGVREIQIEALPTDLPEFIEVDISELPAGQSLHAGEVPLTGNLRLAGSPDEVVATIVSLTKLAAREAAAEEAAAEVVEGAPAEEAAKAEGEGES